MESRGQSRHGEAGYAGAVVRGGAARTGLVAVEEARRSGFW